MGKVLIPALMENLEDLYAMRRGEIQASEARSVTVADALVDTGATGLSMPASLIARLGLTFIRVRRARTAAGVVDVRMFDAVKLTVQGRDCLSDVMEMPDGSPVLIGQVPLEIMDWVVDPGRRRLIGNPEHGGEQMVEVYSFFP